MKLTVTLFKLLLTCLLLSGVAFAQNDRRQHQSWGASSAQPANERQSSGGICTNQVSTCATDGASRPGSSSQLLEASSKAEASNDAGIREIRVTNLSDSLSSTAPKVVRKARPGSQYRRRTTYVRRDNRSRSRRGIKSETRQ